MTTMRTTEQEFASMMQSTLGRCRCDLVVAAHAMTGPSAERLLVAAELIEKTQSELSAITTPPLPVPGPGRP